MHTRRQFTIQLGCLGALGLGRVAQAQPNDLARLLVGFPPGGSTDNVARRLADKLRGAYAANVIVDNKPGAGAQIAVATVKDAAPDGATLLLSPPAPFTVYPYTYRRLPYATEDVAPVAMVCTFPFALAVGPGVPASVRNLQDFVAWAKATPAKASFGSPAAGSTPHLVGSLLGRMAGFEFTHVAYKGDGPGLQDLMGGQIASYSTVLGSYLPHLQSGRLRLLAVSGTERSSFAPELPTYREQGYPALDMAEWFGIFVPARTPAALVQRAGDAVRAAVAQPDFARGLAEFGMTARSSTAQELGERLRTESAQWRTHVKNIGFTADT
ncbi:Bug family tripartite tricarboxylate transporter substrate binding protein [Pseudorhodoferax sp. LjRoot39]|uniref:Bug family tripartite tricarboxylate transporter substrate binding protein n=1 Tax=Pseudorhodoferax sp. LjRoot39 TaxID=3342328 RepID=UPI003ECEA61A